MKKPILLQPHLLFCLLGFLPFTPAHAEPSPATTALARELAAIDQPTVGARVELAGPIAIGSATFTPSAGTAVRQLTCGGQPCGFYLAGPGVFELAVGDRFTRPIAARNLANLAPKLAAGGSGGLAVRETFRDAVVWRLGLEAQTQAGTAAGGPAALPAWLNELLERPFFRRPGAALAAAAGSGSPEAAYALLHGERELLRFTFDPLYTGFETLQALRRDSTYIGVDRDRHFAMELVRQPIRRQWWQRFPDPLVATQRKLEVDNYKDEEMKVHSSVTLRASRDGMAIWEAELAEQVYEGNRRFPVEVRAVTVGGEPADWAHRDGQLLVRLGRPLKTGETVEVAVDYGGRLALQPGGDSLWTYGGFPSSSLAGEMATLEMTVRAPAPFIPFGSGKVVSREKKDGFNVVHTRYDGKAQFVMAAAGKYEVADETREGTTVHVATYSFSRKDGAARIINNFFAAKKFYEQLFGMAYPFDELTILEIPEWGWGQAPTGMILLTQEAYSTNPSISGRLASMDLNMRFLHEVAHGFWGHLARMDSLEEQWISEAFAEYSSGLALRAMYGGEKGDKAFKAALDSWSGIAKGAEGGSIYLANYLRSEDWTADRFLLLYFKGAAVIHAIREKLQKDLGSPDAGDRAFIAFLRTILKSFPDSWAYTQHYPAILEQISPTGWQAFFESYVYGTESPPAPALLKGGKAK